ncbi:MAG TPA: RNA polymerase-binding protein DksA [Rhodanobacteraceae bacterium]
MAQTKQHAAKASPKKPAKPTAKSAKAKPAKKPAAKPAHKAPAKASKPAAKKAAAPKAAKLTRTVKAAKVTKATKVTKASKTQPRKATKPKVMSKTTHTSSKTAHAHPPAKRPETPAHSHPAHPPAGEVVHASARKQAAHAKPTGGVAARLNVASSAEQTITREDGRYALPSTVNIDLPKGYHPSAKEEYMSPKQLAYFRQKLKDWRDQLVEESRQTMENLREEVRDVGDDAERATRETENSLELRTRDRYRKLISKIEKALRKIEEGRYGYCEETDEEIGLERLEARPIATLSLDAQERREHLQKQMGD